jgi:hypothetical protein
MRSPDIENIADIVDESEAGGFQRLTMNLASSFSTHPWHSSPSLKTRGGLGSQVWVIRRCLSFADTTHNPSVLTRLVSTVQNTYRIAVSPHLLREGEFKGHMEYVDFFADDGKGSTIEWWETNYGQLAESFRRLVEPAIADNLIAILRTNEQIHIPGEFTIDQVHALQWLKQGHE